MPHQFKSAKYLLLLLILIASTVSASDKTPDSATIDKIDDLMQDYYKAEKINGVILIAHSDSIIYESAFGNAVHEWDIPNDSDTKFLIGSITKQFTAAIILQLAEENKLSLDDHIVVHLPEYREDIGSKVTIHHLLNHTSGIPNFAHLPKFWTDSIRNHYTRPEMIEDLCSGDLKFEPGENFHYSNSGYNLLGYIIEEIEGKPFREVLSERVFVPLEMNNSGWDDPKLVVKKRATGYHHRIWGIEKSRYFNPEVFHASGAIYSTAHDILTWTRSLHTGQVLSDQYYAKMITPNLRGYGYGIGAIRIPKPGSTTDSLTTIAHSGGIIGFDTDVCYVKEGELTIVQLNNINTPVVRNIRQDIIGILYGSPAIHKPRKSSARLLHRLTTEISIDSATQVCESLHAYQDHDYDLSEPELNSLGYQLLIDGMLTESRLMFETAVKLFPESSNLYDSYAESCLMDGDTTAAIQNYRKSLELNEDNKNAAKMINQLTGGQ